MSVAKDLTGPTGRRVRVILQRAVGAVSLPKLAEFRAWAGAAAVHAGWSEIGVRVVNSEESADLNLRYRGKQGPTNVLSFPFELPPGVDNDFVGDLVICAPVVEQEAATQGKPLTAHWAHLVIHGTLHLQGYDHEIDAQAAEMEALESRILCGLGYPNPYL